MAKQKDPDSIATGGLNIRPKFLIVPIALGGLARTLMTAEKNPGASNPNAAKPNHIRGMATVIDGARLDTHSSKSWYLAADPNMHDTIEVAYLNGNETPMIDQQDAGRSTASSSRFASMRPSRRSTSAASTRTRARKTTCERSNGAAQLVAPLSFLPLTISTENHMKTFVQDGDTLSLPAPYDVASGTGANGNEAGGSNGYAVVLRYRKKSTNDYGPI